MKLKKVKEGVMALTLTMLVMFFLAGLSLAMFDVGKASFNLTNATVESNDSRYLLESGAKFFIREATKASLQNKSPEEIEAILKSYLGKKMSFGNHSSWFELTKVTRVESNFLLDIVVPHGEPAVVAKSTTSSLFAEKAWAASNQTMAYRFLIGPLDFSWLGVGLYSDTVNSGQKNVVDDYGSNEGYIATKNLDPQLTLDGVEKKEVPPLRTSAADVVDQRVAEALTYFDHGSLDPSSPAIDAWKGIGINQHQHGSSCPNTLVGKEYTFDVYTSLTSINEKSGRLHFQEEVYVDEDVILGDLYGNIFSYVKFEKKVVLEGNGKTLRLGPGMYHFGDKLVFQGNNPQLILDVTHGPVQLIFAEGAQLTVDSSSNNLAIFVYHDNSGDYSTYAKKIDSENKGNPFGPEGRKIASAYFDLHANTSLPKNTNNGLFGGFAVGTGVGAVPSVNNSEDSGNEIYKNGEKWELVSTVTEPTTEHFQFWASSRGGDCNHDFIFDRNNIQFIGTILAPRRNVSLSKQNVNFYGGIVAETVNVEQQNAAFHIDNRLEFFDPQPIKGSFHLKFMQEVDN